MNAVMKPVARFMNVLYRIFQIYSQIVLLVIVLIVSAQVLMRQFNNSIPWSEEVALFLMVWMAFLAMAIGVEENLHISIDMFYNHFPKPVQTFFYYLNNVLIIIVGAFFIIYGSRLVMATMGSTLPATKWPKGLMYLMIPVGGVFVAYFSALRLLRLDRFLPSYKEAEPKGEDA